MSDSKARTVVFITGYGSFGKVLKNPSSSVALEIVEDLKSQPDVMDVRYTMLDVSVSCVTAYFEKVEKEIKEIIEEKGPMNVKIFLCHFGVHTDTSGLMRVEVRGYNELFSSLPDVEGRALNHERIAEEVDSLEHSFESWFGKEGSPQLVQLQRLIQKLNEDTAGMEGESSEGNPSANEAEMPPVHKLRWAISRDAGRYLCNCALYLSLRLQEMNPGLVYSVFIHNLNPTIGESEVQDGPVVVYNPTVTIQSREAKKLVRGLLSMMNV